MYAASLPLVSSLQFSIKISGDVIMSNIEPKDKKTPFLPVQLWEMRFKPKVPVLYSQCNYSFQIAKI